jgi:hypothetical protein
MDVTVPQKRLYKITVSKPRHNLENLYVVISGGMGRGHQRDARWPIWKYKAKDRSPFQPSLSLNAGTCI